MSTKKNGAVGVFASLLLVAGCATEVTGDDEADLIDLEAQVTVPVRSLATFGVIPRAKAKLDRQSNGHEAEEDTFQLPGGHIVTMFMVIFNDPENCTHPVPGLATCTTPDLGNPATNASAVWVDGMQVGSNGEGEFENFVGLGVAGAPGEVVFGPGLVDLQGSEVHFLTRDKGLPIAGRQEEQRTTFAGGCDAATCQDLQFAIFLRAN